MHNISYNFFQTLNVILAIVEYEVNLPETQLTQSHIISWLHQASLVYRFDIHISKQLNYNLRSCIILSTAYKRFELYCI